MSNKNEFIREEDDRKGVEPVEQKPGEISHKDLKAEPTRYGDWEQKGRCTDF